MKRLSAEKRGRSLPECPTRGGRRLEHRLQREQPSIQGARIRAGRLSVRVGHRFSFEGLPPFGIDRFLRVYVLQFEMLLFHERAPTSKNVGSRVACVPEPLLFSTGGSRLSSAHNAYSHHQTHAQLRERRGKSEQREMYCSPRD